MKLKGHQVRSILQEWAEKNVEGFDKKSVQTDLGNWLPADAIITLTVNETAEATIPEHTF